MRIAIFDRNPEDLALAEQAAAALGHVAVKFQSANALLAACEREAFDMLVLEWESAGTDGLSFIQVVEHAREKLSTAFPLLCLLPRSDVGAMRAALHVGITDRQFKPLRAGELRARIAALLAHAYPEADSREEVRFGDYAFELRSGCVEFKGRPLELTRKEFELALLFFRNLGRPLSRAYMQEAVWGSQDDLPSRTIDTHVSRVRSKLGLRPENGFRLAPVYSYGYRLEQLPK